MCCSHSKKPQKKGKREDWGVGGKEGERGDLRCGSARIWSNVCGIEAVEVITDIGYIISRYQTGEADKNACDEELHGDFFLCMYNNENEYKI